MSRKDILNYPEEYYYPEALKEGVLTAKEMRAEYSRLRAVANKRLERFKGTKYEDVQSYIKNVNKFVKLKDIENERDLIYKLYDLKKFVTAKSSSVSGLRDIEKRTIATAHENGMTWLNADNIKDFGDYMDYLRAKFGAKNFDSERPQQVYGVAYKKGLRSDEILKDYTFWKNNLDQLEQLPKFRNPEKRTTDDYKKRLFEAQNKKKRRR